MADKTTKTFTPISTEISKYGVVSLATRPNQPSSYGVGDLSATDLKKRFDFLANQIISEYNKLIELFNSDEILGYLKAHSGSLKSALEQITNTNGDLITKNPADQKGENEVLNDRILAFYNAIVELQAFTEVKDDKHKDKTLSKVYETIANVDLFKKEVEKDKEENAKAHNALSDLITALQDFLGLNEHEGDSPLDGVIKDHISDHNDPESLAHGDIRQSVKDAQDLANEYAEKVVSDHNGAADSHTDIRQNVINAETNAKGYADGILLTHDTNANAHAEIRDTIRTLSDNFTTHQTAEDAHKAVIDATLNSAKSYTDKELEKYIPLSEKGASNGVATLSSDGKVPAAQLPSFVDDVIECDDYSKLPTPGETGKIYVDLKSNKTYRWSGSKYVEISESLALGETSSTAYRGDLGAIAYAHSQITKGNPHGISAETVGLEQVVNTGDSATPVENGTTKFTSGGAYAMKTALEFAISTKVTAESDKGLSTNDFTTDLKNKLEGINLSGYVQKDGNKVLSDNNYTTTEKDNLATLYKAYQDGSLGGDCDCDLSKYATKQFVMDEIDKIEHPEGGGSVDLSGYATESYVNTKIANQSVATTTSNGLMSSSDKKTLDDLAKSGVGGGGASIDEKNVEIGDQVTAKGDYSAAFNKGIIGSETVFETDYDVPFFGTQTITVSLKETFTKGASVESIDVAKNTIDIYGECKVSWNGTSISLDLAYAFSKISGERFNFAIEISAGDIKAYYPAIAVAEVKTNSKTCARLTIHKSCSVSGISTLDKVTNMYGGFAYEDGSMTVNSRNIAWGESSFSSGNGNASIAANSHTQNFGNVVSGTSGSAAGSMTEAGENAYSTGYLTKALGESSLTFGIKSETAYTESKEKEGGKGSVSGGYDTRANARYSQALGVETHSDAVGQLVCGLKNATDPNALFIVGAGNEKNLLSVGKQASKLTSSFAIGADGTTASGLNGAVATGDRTLSKGQSSFTFGIKAETAETTYGDNPVEGGKGSIAGGYEAKANYRYSQAFGYGTHTDAEQQFVCGVRNASDPDALFIVGNAEVGTGAEKNGFVVKKNGDCYSAGRKMSVDKDLSDLEDRVSKLIDSKIESNSTYLEIESFTVDNYSPIVLKGTDITPSFSWKLTGVPKSITIYNPSNTPISIDPSSKSYRDSNSWSYTGEGAKIFTWTLSCKTQDGRSVTKTVSIIFGNYSYFGVGAETNMNTVALTNNINAGNMHKDLAVSRERQITINAKEGEYIYYWVLQTFCPEGTDNITFKIGGIEGGFEYLKMTRYEEKDGSEGYGQDIYYVYRSVEKSLGECTVEIT